MNESIPSSSPVTQEIPRALRAPYQEPGLKTKYRFLFISQYHAHIKHLLLRVDRAVSFQ